MTKKDSKENIRPLTRRDFITRAGGMLAVSAGLGYISLAPEHWPLSLKDSSGKRSIPKPQVFTIDEFSVATPNGFPEIGIGRNGSTEVVLKKALDAVGGLKRFINPGDVVLLKPNAAFDRSPNLGATTHPEIMSALINMLLVDCRAAEVRVTDNPIESPADCFEKNGIGGAVAASGGKLFLPDQNAFRIVETKEAVLIKRWEFLYRPFRGVTKVIGIAPVKDHNLSNASLGIKNWYGLLGGKRNQFHQDIHEIISDLALMIKPTLTILDGTRVLMRNGPTGGNPADVKKQGTIVVGTDPVAVDAWAYQHLLERSEELPGYLYKAEEKGCGFIESKDRLKEIV